MTLPNFLVIGAARSGTDSLCYSLGQHPQVYMSANKEPNFFVAEGRAEMPYCGPGDREAIQRWDMWVNTLDRYQALFAGVTSETAVGEGTTWYLYDEQAPYRIRRHIPRAKLIAILRNPVDRAYSAYTMLLRDARETIPDFARALAAEQDRIRANWEPMWHFTRMGFYSTQVARYYEVFDRSQVRVVLHDDFSARPDEVVRGLFEFLEVDDGFEPDTSERLNASLVPKRPGLHALVAGQSRVKSVAKSLIPAQFRQRMREEFVARTLTKPAPMSPEVRGQLVELFRDDILRLQDLLDRDLSKWLL